MFLEQTNNVLCQRLHALTLFINGEETFRVFRAEISDSLHLIARVLSRLLHHVVEQLLSQSFFLLTLTLVGLVALEEHTAISSGLHKVGI